MIPNNEEDLDEIIGEVISEVCGEQDKRQMKKHVLIVIHILILIIGCFKCCTNSNTEKGFSENRFTAPKMPF